jgi:saccharopine dehydrogenase (NAD+, L-lysine-forming)
VSAILVIGSGAAGSVVVKKCLELPKIFSKIHVASRTLKKCVSLKEDCHDKISISQLDADNTDDVIALIEKVNPKIVINMALPYQDLSIMNACLVTKVHYMDTANYEPKDEAKYSYHWQWDYHDRFKEAGIMALLGSGFDPGVTNVFCSYAQKNLFDEIHEIDIIDCNDGDHGYAFATNFNPEINIREVTQQAKYWEAGHWIEKPPISESRMIDFPEIGKRKGYLMYHEELESLVKHMPHLKRIRFFMTFSDEYINHLMVLQRVGMTCIEPIHYNGQEIVPLQFLKEVLPEPSKLGKNYKGQTCIGCVFTGIKNGVSIKKTIYNVCNHQDAYDRVQAHAISYTTGVPAMIGAKQILEGKWMGSGVFNIEEFDPDPFMADLNRYGLPWHVIQN